MNAHAIRAYERVFRLRAETAFCAKLISGELRLLASLEQPPESYGFPPGLAPFASSGTGPTYWGLRLDPFLRDAPSFCRLDLESLECSVVARSWSQLLIYFAVHGVGGGESLDELLRFERESGLKQSIRKLQEDYLAAGSERDALEWLGVSQSPAWQLFLENPTEQFEAAMSANRLEDAWVSLCAVGWSTYGEHRDAFERFSRVEPSGYGVRVFKAWVLEHDSMKA